MIKSLFDCIKPLNPFGRHLKLQVVEDAPDFLEAGIFYGIGIKGNLAYGVFTCPCGCNEPIHLNLSPLAHPKWNLHSSLFSGLSLSPSVWRTNSCRSHFFIKHGRIIWCRANPED